MAQIHPTAVIGAEVRLADDAVVGPHCVIDGAVEIGAKCELIAQVHISGPARIGRRNIFHPFSVIGGSPQMSKAEDWQTPGVQIADDNVFRESVSINGGTHNRVTAIGSDNLFMANSHVGHDSIVGDHCTLANTAALAGHCVLGDSVNIGGGGMAQQFVRLGRLSFLGGLCGAGRDVPPFCMVHHHKRVTCVNLVGMRRAGLKASIDGVRAAFRVLYQSGQPIREAAEQILENHGEDPCCREFAEFVLASDRGIIRYEGRRRTPESDQI